MSFWSFLEKEVKLGEAQGFLYAANVIEANQAQIAAVAGQAPAGAEALVAWVESNDSKLGPVASAAVNALLNSFRGAIDAEVQSLAQQGVSGVPALVQACKNIAAKLQAEAAAL